MDSHVSRVSGNCQYVLTEACHSRLGVSFSSQVCCCKTPTREMKSRYSSTVCSRDEAQARQLTGLPSGERPASARLWAITLTGTLQGWRSFPGRWTLSESDSTRLFESQYILRSAAMLTVLILRKLPGSGNSDFFALNLHLPYESG